MHSTDSQQRLPAWAIVLNAGALILPVALGQLFSAILKWINPGDIDVSQGLAYLRQILIVAFTLIVIFLVAAVVVDVIMTRRRHRYAPALWLILGVQVLGFALFAVAQFVERSATGA